MLPLLLPEGSCRAVPHPRLCHGRRDRSATCGRASRDGAVRGRQPVEALSRVAPACSPTYRGRQKTRFALTRLMSSSYRNRRASVHARHAAAWACLRGLPALTTSVIGFHQQPPGLCLAAAARRRSACAQMARRVSGEALVTHSAMWIDVPPFKPWTSARRRAAKQSNNQTFKIPYHILHYHTTSKKNQKRGKYHSNTGKC